MKISKLYLKMFLAFFAVLIAAEAMVFLFILSGKIHPPFLRGIIDNTMMAGQLIEHEMDNVPTTPDHLKERLDPLLRILATGFKHGRIWITDDHNTIVSASFDGPPPDLVDSTEPIDVSVPEGLQFYRVHSPNTKNLYLELALRLHDGTTLKAHLLHGKLPPREEEWFFKGLLLLTALGAICFIPVSRRITKPILQLAETAEWLGQGDLSRRVPERGHDEVAILARKFNRMADRLQKMVATGKELTANLSHELRSPLARMRISLQMLMEQSERADGGADSKLLAGMQEEIEGMDLLIGKMLDLSKLEMHAPPPMTDSIDLSGELHSLLNRLTPMIKQSGLCVVTDMLPVPNLLCHALAIQGLLDNILGNAIKFTASGGIIHVALSAQSSELALLVRNTHAPLSQEDLQAMFLPFQRLDNGKTPGTGLGLAMAKKVATLHGGSISARNEAGCICIDIRLPLR